MYIEFMKKILSILSIGILLGSTVAFAATKIFSDVPSNTWYTAAVQNLADKGIISGYSDGTFRPGANVNRAEVAVMLNNLLQYISSGTTPAQGTTYGTYENDYLRVTIPSDWTARSVMTSANPAAVNITKGNYILYINANAQQASGVAGGRFSEISSGAPSADSVVLMPPSAPCGISETVPAMLDHSQVNLYVSQSDKSESCAAPSNGTVWYFSYITDSKNGYFNYYNQANGSQSAFVITMAYNSKDVNSFPVKGSADLTATLNEMTTIVKTLELKK